MRIELKSLGYRYPGAKAPVFDALDLVLEPGVTLAKGFSGCGKSTLLRLIAGLINPSGGTIVTDSTHRVGSPAFLRYEIGFVFQQLNLLPLASVERNISLAVEMAGRDGSDIQHWIDLLGLCEVCQVETHPAFRRPATAGEHRARPGEAPCHPSARRADFRPG